MLYIVGGCSRSGKSMLAERMCLRHGIPWFSLDALKMGLHLGVPASDIQPATDDLATADLMWPIIEPILDHAIFDGRDYLIEGVNLRPRTVLRYIEDCDQPVRVCLLGYPDIAIDLKAAQVKQHTGVPMDWLHRTGAQNVHRYLGISRELSRQLMDECASLDLPFIDTGGEFLAGIRAAERALINPLI